MSTLNEASAATQKSGKYFEDRLGFKIAATYFDGPPFVMSTHAEEVVDGLREDYPEATEKQLAAALGGAAFLLACDLKALTDVVDELQDLIGVTREAAEQLETQD